jgi:hypothetical protein
MDNAIILMAMQVGGRFMQFSLTDAQKKLIQNPVSQSVLMLFMFYAVSRKVVLSVAMVAVYYMVTYVLLNEKHVLNIYSRKWLREEGFLGEEAGSEKVKENYYKNIQALV